MKKIKVGLYGSNGHQIHAFFPAHGKAELVAVAGMSPDLFKEKGVKPRYYSSLDELIADPDVELISLCSPRRADQARDAIACMKAGKHVYSEKPCAMSEKNLDLLIKASKKYKVHFHEMAGTAFEQPYFSMRNIVASGKIGTVVQISAQKSYPLGTWRPQDEDIDGGLMLQNGVHAIRFIEHVGGVKIRKLEALQTKLGNPDKKGGLRIAVSMMMSLSNGGVASAICNDLNPPAFPTWGNEHLRIFGTKGFIESVDGAKRTRLVLNEKDCGPFKTKGDIPSYFDMFINTLHGKGKMPLSIEDELHPLRMLLRARK